MGTVTNTSLLIALEELDQIRFKPGWHNEIDGIPASSYRWSVGVDVAIEIPKILPSHLRKGQIIVEMSAIPYLTFRCPSFQDVIIFLDSALVAGMRFY